MIFFKRILSSIAEPLQIFLNKLNPPKVLLADAQMINDGMSLIAQKILEERMKELELQYHILTTRLLEPLAESQKLLMHIAGMNEEVLNYFEDGHAAFEEDITNNEIVQEANINKYGLN